MASYLFGMMMLFSPKTESSTDDSLSSHGLAPWLHFFSCGWAKQFDVCTWVLLGTWVLPCGQAHTDLLDGECWYVPYHWICLDLNFLFKGSFEKWSDRAVGIHMSRCHFLRKKSLDQVEEGITIMEPRKIATWMRLYKCNFCPKKFEGICKPRRYKLQLAKLRWRDIWKLGLPFGSICSSEILRFLSTKCFNLKKPWPEVVDLVVLVPDWAWHSGVGVWYFMASMAFHGNLFDGPRPSQS